MRLYFFGGIKKARMHTIVNRILIKIQDHGFKFADTYAREMNGLSEEEDTVGAVSFYLYSKTEA